MDYRIVKHFKKLEVILENEKTKVTELKDKGFFSYDVGFQLGGDFYQIKAKGIARSNFEVVKNNREIGDIEFHWNGKVTIRLKNIEGMTKHFILTNKHFEFKYELRDFLTNYLFSIRNKWYWSQFKMNYEFTKEEGFKEEDNYVNEIELVALAAFCINVLKKKQGAKASG